MLLGRFRAPIFIYTPIAYVMEAPVFGDKFADTFHLRKPAMENKPEAAAALYCREVFINKSVNFQNIRIAPFRSKEQIDLPN